MGSDIIEVCLSDPAILCSVHVSWLCGQSAKIAAAVAERANKGERYQLDLAEHHTETVEAFVRWIYQPDVLTLPDHATERYMAIIRLFALAEQQQCRRLMEQLVQAFFDHVNTTENPPCMATIDLAFKLLSSSRSTGRWMVVHACVWHRNVAALLNVWSSKKLKQRDDFAASLCMRQMERLGGRMEKSPFEMDAATYCWLVKPGMKMTMSLNPPRESQG